MDFVFWQKHVNHVVDTRGRWYGLGDTFGNPIMTLPDLGDLGAADQWMSTEDMTFTLPAIDENGDLLPVAERLIMDNLHNIDESGQLPAVSDVYTIIMATRGKDGGIERKAGIVTHCYGKDPDNSGKPTQLVIPALSITDVWNTVTAVSWPNAWWKAMPYARTSDESGLPYSREWLMARVELATRTTFTFKHGKAVFVIGRLAQESLDAAMSTQQDADGTIWVDDPFHVVEVPEVDNSPVISLEARDGSLWDTVAAQSQNAGVILGARLWWPGDPPVRSWELANSTMDASQVDITPSQGEPYRQIIEQTFDHPMVVLTVKEVG